MIIEGLRNLDRKIDKVQDDITQLKVENAKQTACIKQNTIDLTEHKEGVIQNRGRIRQCEKCISVINQPISAKKLFIRVVAVFSGINVMLGASYTVIKYFLL